MLEYYVLRAVLGLMQGGLFLFLMVQTIPRYLLWFLPFLFVSAIDNLFPASLWNPTWWRGFALPMALLRLFLAVFVTVSPLWALSRQIDHLEQRLLVVWAGCTAAALALLGLAWHPENVFQAFEIARQYQLLVLAAASCFIWTWLLHLRGFYTRRTLSLPAVMRSHGILWCLWLIAAFLLSTTTKGGLSWKFVEWHGGLWWWRTVSDICLSLQIGVLVIWAQRYVRSAASSVSTLPASPRSVPSIVERR